jgi:hypothetical protein
LVAPTTDNATSSLLGDWSLTGNAGLDSATNFLGTLDSQKVSVRTNNLERLRVEPNGFIRLYKYLNNTANDSLLTTDATGKLKLIPGILGGNSINVEAIADLTAYNGPKQLMFVRDTARGGFFYRYDGNAPIDSGIVFKDTLNRKWHRYLTSNVVDIRWFGARGVGSAFDNYNAISNAIKACRNNTSYSYVINTALTITGKNNVRKLFIPAADDYYYCSATLVIDGSLELEADRPNTAIFFPFPMKGMVLKYPWAYSFKNLSIRSNAPASSTVDTSHGFVIRSRVYFDNVSATGFGGDGFNMECDLVADTLNPANCNTSAFYNCHSYQNMRNGFRLKGGDANAVNFYSCEAVANGALGVDDQSFLGNSYHGFHSATNCSPEVAWQRGLAKIGSVTYAAIKDGLLATPGGTPGSWENDWVVIPYSNWANFAYVQAYSSSKKYLAGGAYNLDGKNTGENQTGTVVGCYSEGDQPPSYFGQRTLVIGGTQGSGIRKGVYLFADAQAMQTPNRFMSNNRKDGRNFSFMDQNGLGNIARSLQGITMSYDTVRNVGTFKPYSGYELMGNPGVSIGMSNTDATYWQRPSNDVSGALITPKLLVTNKDNGSANVIQPAWYKPTTTSTTAQNGDLYLNAPYYYGSEKNDVLGWRFSPTLIGTSKWVTMKAENEFDFTTSDASNIYLEEHYYIPKLFKYIMDITCSDNAGRIWTEHRIISVGINAGLPYIMDDQYENRSLDPALASASVKVACSSSQNYILLQVNGIAATNLNWKIQIKRINL